VEVTRKLPNSVSRAEMKVILAGVILGLLAVGSIFSQSNGPDSQTPSASPVTPLKTDTHSSARDNYAGDSACASCHRERVDSFHQTAHYLTSRLPERNSILGSFMPGANAFTTSNPDLSFRMDAKGTEFFQTAVQGIAPYTTERTERFGLVVGSGGKGQTYLSWKGDQLFQLPVSYWTELGWVNSPGYRDGVANFDRPIMPRCLECHATYFETTPPPFNRYRKEGFVVGISCEKCHGPGRGHVKIEGSKSGSSGSGILNPAKFSRDRQMDVCAWCHAGAGEGLAPAFSYLPGESLGKYLALPPADPNSPIDVHGSQVELLEKSRCFQLSEMTCSTCHDVHTGQHDLATFSRRCLSCHKPGTAAFPKLNHKIDADCIGCHMPKRETNLIVFDWNGRKVRPQVRTHWIKAYPVMNHSD
jgi:predicted CXXCH cytochrome family protein